MLHQITGNSSENTYDASHIFVTMILFITFLNRGVFLFGSVCLDILYVKQHQQSPAHWCRTTEAKWPRRGVLGPVPFRPRSRSFCCENAATQQPEQNASTCAAWSPQSWTSLVKMSKYDMNTCDLVTIVIAILVLQYNKALGTQNNLNGNMLNSCSE